MFSPRLRASHPDRVRKHPTRRLRSFVPRVESLEGRDVPSTLLASGLEGSQGSAVGPGGALFVTEGVAGRLSRVDPDTGDVTTVATGLPTGPFAGLGGGAIDVAFIGNTAYVLVTAVAPDIGGDDIVGIYRVDGPTSFTVIADIGAWSLAHPPETDFFLPTGNQYALEPFRSGFLVTDGHHNRVLQVTLDGEITEVIAFGNIVPTGLEVRGNTVYVAQAGPIPHLPENGKVVSFRADSPAATEVASGAPLMVDVEFGRGNTLFALSQGDWDSVFEGDPALPDTGALVRVNGDGTFTVIEDELNRPTSVEIIGNTAYVVSLDGEILKIEGVSGPPYGRLAAVTSPVEARHETLRPAQARPLLAEALARWRAAGADTSGLGSIDVRVADLPGATLGRAVGRTIWLDVNAAGWGWFVDGTPREDSEFRKAGNQGERHRIDLLSVVTHETGHLLGRGHGAGGVMAETLRPGTRSADGRPDAEAVWHGRDAVFALLAGDEATARVGGPFARGRKTR